MIRIIIGFFFLAVMTLIWRSTLSEQPVSEAELNKRINPDSTKQNGEVMEKKVIRTEEEWKKILTSEQYYVLRQKGTERAFTGKYDKHFEKGVYKCAACDNVLFESDTKFDSGCGWPSFFTPLAGDRVVYEEDKSYGMVRTEVMCAKCGGHLGHVFDDGPEPTGLRYCMNSVSLKFEKIEE